MQRRFFDVVAMGFVVLLLVFVLYNGKYIQLFNDKFMACSTSHRMSPELNKGALVSNTGDDFDISDDKSDGISQISDSSETSTSTHESTDLDNSDDSSDSASSNTSKYLDVDVYDISWGDTLSGISRLTGTSVDELVKLNNISNPNLIYSGSSIKIRQVR